MIFKVFLVLEIAILAQIQRSRNCFNLEVDLVLMEFEVYTIYSKHIGLGFLELCRIAWFGPY